MTSIHLFRRFGLAACCCAAAWAVNAADPSEARAALARDQAIAETQRLGEQFDVLSHNQETVNARLAKLEASIGEIADLKAEIVALKTDNAALRKELVASRQQTVDELSRKIATLPPPAAAESGSSGRRSSVRSRSNDDDNDRPSSGPTVSESGYEHVVEAGQTLSSIAGGYGTTVRAIKNANRLKSDNLRIGQKLFIPDNGKGKK